jgi:hypothetical protein
MQTVVKLPTHCPYCHASIAHHQDKTGFRIYTCGAQVNKETEKFTYICDRSKQQGLF